MSDLVKKVDLQSIIDAVLSGTATEEQTGMIARQVQIGMSATLVQGMQSVYDLIQTSGNMLRTVQARFQEKLQVELDADTVSLNDMAKMIDVLQKNQITVLDLYRKVTQGKELFSQSMLSEEEKAVVKLLGSFTSKEEKQRFLKLVKETLDNQKASSEEEETQDFD